MRARVMAGLLGALGACSAVGACLNTETSSASGEDNGHPDSLAMMPPTRARPAMSTQDPVRAAYIAAVQASASAEYFVEEAGSGRFQARNPAQGLVSRFAAEGVRIASTSTERPFSAEIALVRHGCEGDLRAVSPARPDDASDTRVDYERGEVLEWYENGPLGIEQGIVIDSPPACETDSSTVVIDLSVSGDLEPVSRGDGASVDLVDSSGRIALRYTDLFVTDATGRQLPARVDAENGLLTISVSAEGAAYPLMIDPLFSALEQKLVAPLGGANGSFGMSVAISGDTAVVGVPNDFGYYNGAVRVFVRSNGAWSQQATFYGEGGDYFGGAVAIDGDTIVVGAPNDDDFSTNAGAAHIYTRNNGVWSYGGQILPSGLYPVSHFGTCVAIDGDLVVVTDPYAYSIWIGGGLVYPYHRNGNNWDAWPVVVSNNVAGSAKFGASVAVDGPWVVAGAPDEHSVYFIHPHAGGYWYDKFTGAWGQHLGQQVAISGDTGAAAEGAQIKLYAYNGISWVPSGITLTPAPATGWEISALALQGDALLVGMKYDDTLAIDAGSAFLFERTQGVWAQTAQLTAFDSAANDWFGTSVDLDGTTAIVGAPGDDDLGMDSGSAYVFGPSKALGLQCFGAADCASGFCVDGVCCDSACGGGASDCQACSIAMGAVADGTCTIAPPGPVCRPSTGVCDPAEACNGASGSCPADVLAPAGTVCRAAAGVCDSAETCNGVAGSCPPDVFSPSTTVCRAAVGNCDFAEKCTGSSIACPGDIVKAAGVACRASAGVCDPAEACNGVSGSCPADVLTPAGTVCRAAVGTCDVAETCSGAAAACPADALKPGGEVCRPSAGACDVAETCSGASGVCPLDQLAAPGVVCRSSGGACDPAELCDGTMPQCPVDSVDPAGSVCRPAAGLCDAVEVCDGTGKGCGPDLAAPAGSVCRASTGSCDPAEACDGVSDSCPADALAPPGTLCRAAVGTCDVAETCNGAAAACPADALKPGGEVCRPSAGACDVAETCNGASGVCPLDQLAAPGLVCRPSGGACDPAEICNGIGPQCPFDSIEPAGTICRPAAGVCDLAEACDGVIGSCPDDILAPDGTACEDGTCQDGICAGQGAGGGGAGGGTSNTGAAGTGGAGAGGGGGVSNTGGAGAGGGGGVSNTGGAGAGGGGGASNTGGAGGGGGASSGGGTSDAGEAGHGGEPSDTGDAGHGGEPAGTGQSQTDEPGETPSCACAVPGSSSGTRAPVPQLSLLLALAALRLLRRSREAISRGGGGRSTARSLPRSRRGRTVG